ncbi:hypothetical protein YP76_08685 [Sphingobium chungbukense]|uniref:Uncharacterized protein n=1 Tax=Sphingobium chungbukense TaxID=56193 RepID=A0A0M3AWI4_9SPHN|nr:hypothetical protein YP76_08685 [Sphingobium chungbukense]
MIDLPEAEGQDQVAQAGRNMAALHQILRAPVRAGILFCIVVDEICGAGRSRGRPALAFLGVIPRLPCHQAAAA